MVDEKLWEIIKINHLSSTILSHLIILNLLQHINFMRWVIIKVGRDRWGMNWYHIYTPNIWWDGGRLWDRYVGWDGKWWDGEWKICFYLTEKFISQSTISFLINNLISQSTISSTPICLTIYHVIINNLSHNLPSSSPILHFWGDACTKLRHESLDEMMRW